jgi:ribosomal protein L11 methyltransferase
LIETTIRLRAERVEELLDDLLPVIPGGVHHREEVGEGVDELVVFDTAGGPEPEELRRLAGDRIEALSSARVPDGPAERRSRLYRPLLVGPVWIRPAWAPAAPDHALEVVLGEASGFGTGAHPTTRGCLELLLGHEPQGSFADLGCGSGVLAIVAAKLGWGPVTAVDVSADAVESAAANARASGADVDARTMDLLAEPAPLAPTAAANVPPFVHEAIAASMLEQVDAGAEPPATMILSGISQSERAEVARSYARLGLAEVAVGGSYDWAVVELRRGRAA